MTDKILGMHAQAKNVPVQGSPRVLLVDDDAAIQHFLASRLGKFGIELLYASNVTHAYRIASKARPSAIIVDNFMPNGDAKYLLSRLRSSPATESIPVIVISGQQLDAVTEQDLRREVCGKPGAAHVFKKSFDTSELFNALKKYCDFG